MDMTDVVCIKDHGVELKIPLDACILYHGRDSIGGMVLGFRLIQWALKDICGNVIPEREDITFKTAFPGPGLRDAVEMVTRAVTRGAYFIIDEKNAPQESPEGVYGRLYFEIFVGNQSRKVSLVPGAVNDEFIKTGRRTKTEELTPELIDYWRELKESLAKKLKDVDIINILQLH
ncbi:hypothetical protein MM859_005260 [Escherichia coli]|nr:hypothetical protein [Escherichia coli]